MSLLIDNVIIFTNTPGKNIFSNSALVIQDNKISAIGEAKVLKARFPALPHLNGNGRLLMPGLVNAHMHSYSTFARGIAMQDSPANFSDVLEMLWWKLDRTLDLDAVYYSALVPAITAVKRGVTSVIDHHASPNAVDGSLDRVEEALSQLGLRASLCYEISDRDGAAIAAAGLVENERYIKKCLQAKAKNANHLFDGLVGLHASFTLEDSTLEKAAALSASLASGCHIHTLEDAADQRESLRKYNRGVIERLRHFDILGSKSIAVHCIHLNEGDKDSLAESGSSVVHNPQSNMNNAVGRTDIFGFLARDVLLGLGTDGMSPDLAPDIRTANLLHKHDLKKSTVGWNEIQTMVLENNPAIFERVTGQKVGRLEVGAHADMILVDYFPPTPLTGENFWGHFLYGIADAEVDTTIINGDIVMQNKIIASIDEARIAHEAQVVAKRVWKKFLEKN
ncbi:MAG: putative aminohydrolase SsnA [Calditrichaeota bacterium]|nr:MAG: putative aminohydrolase SsnA [Calditrichota bacterium]